MKQKRSIIGWMLKHPFIVIGVILISVIGVVYYLGALDNMLGAFLSGIAIIFGAIAELFNLEKSNAKSKYEDGKKDSDDISKTIKEKIDKINMDRSKNDTEVDENVKRVEKEAYDMSDDDMVNWGNDFLRARSDSKNRDSK